MAQIAICATNSRTTKSPMQQTTPVNHRHFLGNHLATAQKLRGL